MAETTKAYKQAKSKLTHAENEIKRLEQQMTQAKNVKQNKKINYIKPIVIQIS